MADIVARAVLAAVAIAALSAAAYGVRRRKGFGWWAGLAGCVAAAGIVWCLGMVVAAIAIYG